MESTKSTNKKKNEAKPKPYKKHNAYTNNYVKVEKNNNIPPHLVRSYNLYQNNDITSNMLP